MSLAVVTCHFNFAGYDMPVRNLHRFIRQMDRDGISVYGIELHLAGTKPEIRNRPNWITYEVTDDNIIWQKEALMNAAEKIVPDSFKNVAFLDADIFFASPHWISDAHKALERFPVVQMFAEAIWTDRRGRPELVRPSVGRAGLDLDNWTTHPGFGWAFNREIFREFGGWYDVAPLGSGDTLLSFALTKGETPHHWIEKCYSYLGPLNHDHFDRWRERVRYAMEPHLVSFVPGKVYHEWHGDRKNRNYANRHLYIGGLDVNRHLKFTEEGYLQWSEEAPEELKANMKRYFLDRDEDGLTDSK